MLKYEKPLIRKGGDVVTVTLYLLSEKGGITENESLETFKEAKVLKAFKKLSAVEKNEILDSIMVQKNEEKQLKLIIKHIDQLGKFV